MISIGLGLLYNFHKDKKYNKKRKSPIRLFVKLINIICITMFICVSLCDLIHFILTEKYDKPLNDLLFIDIRIIGDILYFSSSLLLYSILMSRLYSIFQNTAYFISWRISFLFICMVVIYIICATFFELDLIKYERNGSNNVSEHRMIICALLIIDDIALNILVLLLFVIRLRRIVLDIAYDEVSTQIDVESTFSEKQIRERSRSFTNTLSHKMNLYTATDKKAKLILIMTRLTVLWYVYIKLNHCC